MSETLPTDPIELSTHFKVLAKNLETQYDTTHDITTLQEALIAFQSALSALPSGTDNASRCDLTESLYQVLNKYYQRTGALGALESAIDYAKETVEAAQNTQDNLSQVHHLSNLAVFLSMKHARTGDLEVLEEAIFYCEVAIALVPESDLETRASACYRASVFSDRKYSQTREPEDLHRAVRYGRDSVESSGNASAMLRTARLNNLGKFLYLRYRLKGDIDDLRKSVDCVEEFMTIMPPNHPEWSHNISNAIGISKRVYEESDNISDFRRLVSSFRKQVEATPHLHPGRIEVLQGLCCLLADDYIQTGALKIIREAITHAEEVLELTPRGHPSKPDHLSSLANYLAQEYQDTGNLETLERAISYNEEAISLNDPTANRVSQLSCISLSLGSRYERKGDLDDLRRSILYAKEGVAVANRLSDDAACVPIMNNLARLQYMMFKRDLMRESLAKMMSYAEAALEKCPPDSSQRYIALSNLTACLDVEYNYIKDPTAISRAIEIVEELLAMPMLGGPRRSRLMANMSVYLLRKNEIEKLNESEMQRALHYSQEALSEIPEDHNDRAALLFNLGFVRNEVLSPSDRDASNTTLRIFTEAWECSYSPPLYRINGARFAAELLAKDDKWEESSQLLEDAIRMLPKVSTRALEGQDKQQILSNISGLPTTAACMALRAGKSAYHALGLLELSRGIIIGSTIDYRGDISDLKERHPKVFQKFDSLRTKIDTPLPDSYDSAIGSPSFKTEEAYLQARSRAFQGREEALQEMEETLNDIRKIPGCEGFQLVPSETELKSWAEDGPVVTFVSSKHGSHAIILTGSLITALPLPNLEFDKIRDRLSIIFEKPAKSKKKKSPAAEIREYAGRNQKIRETLQWLWDVAVKPVLQHLDIIDEYGTSKNDKPAHIWWIGTGRLNIAPFHAAGDHSRGSTQNALSHVISSYTPTIKALSYAREKKLNIFSKSDPRLLLVSMIKTPGGSELLDAGKEVEGIIDITKGFVSKHLEQPSADDVLKQFGSFEVMHFACHGVSNPYDPSESHLMLQKDSETADSLTVAAISRKNAKTAQIAYLSACSTASNGSFLLADEIIHIASGFQLAGFNHVLATMWPAESAICTEIAVNFYRFLFDGKDNEEGHMKVSRALHDAILAARDKNLLLPLRWAPFIHLGA